MAIGIVIETVTVIVAIENVNDVIVCETMTHGTNTVTGNGNCSSANGTGNVNWNVKGIPNGPFELI